MLLYSHPHYSCKDACLAFHEGLWHIFFSAFDEERSVVAKVTSPDLKHFSELEILFDGQEQGWIGMCSPDLARSEDGWVLVFNSWGMKTGAPNALHVSCSTDLIHWSPAERLAPNLAQEDRVIDGALAWTGSGWMLACKWWRQLRFAHTPSLEGPWDWVEEAGAQLLDAESGEDNGYKHENFQILFLDGRWVLLSTDYVPGQLHHHPWLYELIGDPANPHSWMRWHQGRRLQVEAEAWNHLDPDNAAALWDHRDQDGHFYLIYGGKDEQRLHDFNGSASAEKAWPRGWNRLGLARSSDLITWHTSPEPSHQTGNV